MKIKICVPSYKRPDKVDTLRYLPGAHIYVGRSEFKTYKRNYPKANIVGIPDRYQGNLCRVRNKILDDNRDIDVVCITDDDLKYIGCYEDNTRYMLENEKEVLDFIRRYSILAYDLGVKLWGINVNDDKQCYREYSPFSMLSYIGGPFMCHLKTDLRFDERLPLKEDYDFTLQNLNKYRKVLRVNKYHYQVKQVKQIGGCSVGRNLNEEKRQFGILQKKWGSRIIQKDTGTQAHRSRKIKTWDINPIMRVPIPGI